MADLDDFFAKKDRKKAKGKKFTTTEEIAKKLEETGKRLGKSKPKDKPVNPEGEETQQTEVSIPSYRVPSSARFPPRYSPLKPVRDPCRVPDTTVATGRCHICSCKRHSCDC